MNSSSTIEISKSSLISLKAEILRKQQEVNKAKILQASIQQTQTPLREKSKGNVPTENNEPSNKGIESRQAKDDEEDVDLLQKSRKTLEQKAKLYNRLVKGPGSLSNYEIEMNKHYLVQFDRKENTKSKESSDEEHFSDEYDPPDNPDEEWVEYTDCLGRTRKCLRKDLEFLKGKDVELSKNLGSDGKLSTKEWVIDKKGDQITEDHVETNNEPSFSNVTENSEMLSSDMRRELLRKEWEEQEQELMNKTDIHYQDILFNEARSHGVGYYAFSKDDEERAKQQAELQKMRKETIDKQKASLDQKAMRDKQLAARLKAARNRKRARMGLPPEEDEPEEPAAPVIPEEPIDESEKQKRLEKETLEKAKEVKRRKHVRAWDIGKEGIVPHYEYSQEEWADKKRSERPKEFAPPSQYNESKHKHRRKQNDDDDDQDYSKENKSLYFTSKKSKSKDFKKKSINPYKNSSDSDETNDEKPSSSHSSRRNMNYYKNDSSNDSYLVYDEPSSSTTFIPTPIIDECDEIPAGSTTKETEVKSKRKGAEIAPPPTFDYYGPSSTKQQKTGTFTNLEDSIAAGLRFLREKAEFKQKHGGSRSEFDNC